MRKAIHLEDQEEIVTVLRRHWFVLAAEVVLIVFLALLPAICFSVLNNMFDVFAVAYTYLPYLVAAYVVFLLILWMSLFNVWTNYYLDTWVITTRRLITIDQRGFFHRATGSFRLERLQDVEVSVSGILPTFFDFGTVEIRTASDETFIMRGLPDPSSIKTQLMEASGAPARPQL